MTENTNPIPPIVNQPPYMSLLTYEDEQRLRAQLTDLRAQLLKSRLEWATLRITTSDLLPADMKARYAQLVAEAEDIEAVEEVMRLVAQETGE